ncbi:MAG: ATP-binding protein [Halodesulfurarchaeum sp.]
MCPWGEPGAEVRIEDNGPGIRDHELRVHENGIETPLRHSTGVGLWLTDWVIEMSGDTLTFEDRNERSEDRYEWSKDRNDGSGDRDNGGTIVRVRLPLVDR